MLKLCILFIKRFCQKHDCYNCPLRDENNNCKLKRVPSRWLDGSSR